MKSGAVLLVLSVGVLVGAVACSTDGSSGAPPRSTTVAHMSLTACGSVTDAEIAASLRISTIERVFTSPLGCQWESDVSGTETVRTWWYRGVPIADARKAVDAAHASIADISIGGLSGFSARANSGDDCSIDVVRGLDVVAWEVTSGRPQVDACGVGRRLAQLSAARMKQ